MDISFYLWLARVLEIDEQVLGGRLDLDELELRKEPVEVGHLDLGLVLHRSRLQQRALRFQQPEELVGLLGTQLPKLGLVLFLIALSSMKTLQQCSSTMSRFNLDWG